MSSRQTPAPRPRKAKTTLPAPGQAESPAPDPGDVPAGVLVRTAVEASPGQSDCPPEGRTIDRRVCVDGLRVPLLLALSDGQWHALEELEKAPDVGGRIAKELAEAVAPEPSAEPPAKGKVSPARRERLGRRRLLEEEVAALEESDYVEKSETEPGVAVRLTAPDPPDGRFEIEPQLETLIPPLAPEELRKLEEGLLLEGRCLDPLTTWRTPDGRTLLLDGHHRDRSRRKYHLPPPLLVELYLPDRQAAEEWIRRHQLGRRNLTPLTASYLRGASYNVRKGTQGRRRATQNPQSEDKRTALLLATEFRVGRATIERDGAFAAAVDALVAEAESIQPGGGRRIKDAVLTRGARLTRSDAIRLADLPDQKRAEILRDLLSGKTEAVKRKPPRRDVMAVRLSKGDAKPQAEAVVQRLGRAWANRFSQALVEVLAGDNV